MRIRLKDLLPNSDLSENIEYLQAKALELRRGFVQPGEAWGAYGQGTKFKAIKEFEALIAGKEELLGPERVTRILLNNVPSIVNEASLNPPNQARAAEWAGHVLVNIERELEVIDAKRILLISVLSAVIAVFSAMVATAALVSELLKTLFGRS